ncbi:ORF23 [Leucania separata nucleopolyhedrovirus]|uniref:ORF23 n=1 Tax=Leucania separata nucleopolyhedrovirus TaxID=1307956 RepID=Q0IL96_NPVLS|nr:ORF23 [Leucania separata nucleopolyhedrovirus]AAR28787.1 ORF23 [Leucania separata nucleopolyhedrovirus]
MYMNLIYFFYNVIHFFCYNNIKIILSKRHVEEVEKHIASTFSIVYSRAVSLHDRLCL